MRADRAFAGLRVLSKLGRSVRTLLLVAATVLFLSAPSYTSNPKAESDTPPTTVASTAQTSTARTGQGAAAYLPDASKWSFKAKDTDLVSWVDPIGHGIELIQKALDTKDAPRAFVDKPSNLDRFTLAMQLSASAIKCLNKHGHLELHAYTDRSFGYSVSVVLVIDAQAYRDVVVPLCAVQTFSWALVLLSLVR